MEANAHRYLCPRLYYGLLITVLPFAQFAKAEGGITTDVTTGAVQTLSLPGDAHDVTIKQNDGMTVGNNLFHSFAQFNINTGQTVTFTGDAAIQNIISRVTGGEASSIDGTLKSDIGQAAVYFINPAGIVFGQHAKVDVPGAFYASTANELQFADGNKFSATNPQASSLSMAAPAAFGFLGTQTGTLALNGANLEFKAGATVQLSANQITMNNQAAINVSKTTTNPAGIDLQLLAVGDAKQAVDVATLPDHALRGNITLADTTLDASGNGGGRIAVRAGDINALDSKVWADNTGDKNVVEGQGIDMAAVNLNLDNTSLTSDAAGDGNASGVKIAVQKTLSMDKKADIHSNTTATGDSGQVTVNAEKIQIVGGAKISSRTAGQGNANQVTINADKIQMDGGASINSESNGQGDAGNVNVKAKTILIDGKSVIYSSTVKDYSGRAGSVNVIAQDELAIVNGGDVVSIVAGKGSAEPIIIEAGKIWLEGKGSIASATQGQGNAADIIIKAKNLLIDGKSSIYSATLEDSKGNAGNVTISAQDKLIIDNAQIMTFADGEGHPGQMTIDAGKISMSEGAQITAGTTKQSRAGDINVRTQSLQIDGLSFISSAAGKNSSGDGGTVSIDVQNDLSLSNRGSIFASTLGKGNAGQVIINTGTARLDGQAVISSNTIAQGNGGMVSVKASTIQIDGASRIESRADRSASLPINGSIGNAGRVEVIAQNDLLVLNGGAIQTDTYAEGNAGAVNVNAGTIRMDGRQTGITSTAQSGSTGNAGSVMVTARNELNITNLAQIGSSSFASGNAGSVAVQAETIQIQGHNKDDESATGIFSTAELGFSGVPKGNVGSVSVTASKALLMNRGDISIFSEAISDSPGQTNHLNVTAPQINLTNYSLIVGSSTGNAPASAIEINTNQLTVKDDSRVNTSANQGNGGPISINANDWLFLNNSQIKTSVTGTENGNGGDITLNGDVLVMDSGFIQANTNASNASGGNINLNIKQLVYGQDNLQRGGRTPLTFIPNSGLNVIQAASPTGVNGDINISAPQLNIVGALVGLNNPELDLNRVGHDPCSETLRHSTLKKLGKGGVPMFNKGQDGYTIDHLLDAAPQKAANTQQSANLPSEKQDCKPKPA